VPLPDQGVHDNDDSVLQIFLYLLDWLLAQTGTIKRKVKKIARRKG